MNKTGRLVETDPLSRIAWLYFIKGYTQREISEMLELSRMQVQRSIAKSKKTGLVQIQIMDPLVTCFEKEDWVKERFSLSNVVVVPTPQDQAKLKEALGRAAAAYLMNKVKDNQVIGVGWGTTLYAITRFLSQRVLTNSHVVSVIGGWTKRLEESPYEVATKVAHTFNSDCYYISAPAMADSAESKSIIISEKSVSRSLEMAKQADLVIVGIGNASEDSSLVRAGFLSPDEVDRIRKMGAVGDICAQFYDQDGAPIGSDIMERVIGIDLEDLKKIGTVIGVAGGTNKREAILGALRGRYLTALITDERTVTEVLNLDGSDSLQRKQMGPRSREGH
jgi:DNA-binding transcriptional regulator LsrR (DeoR family)